MKTSRALIAGGGLVVLIGGILVGFTATGTPDDDDDPWAHVPPHKVGTDHSHLLNGPFETGQDVTRACLECHPDSASQVMATSHFTWAGQLVRRDGEDGETTTAVGKLNAINNFCIGVQPNMPGCTRCHIGYGWDEPEWDPTEAEVDCLVCHADTNVYWKARAGNPADAVDLVAAAQSVGPSDRNNCGTCHFEGGGGDGVKHGDLDGSMGHPTGRIDVHMGKYDMSCTDCHQTHNHVIPGASLGVSLDRADRVACTDCHSATPHRDERLNNHTATVACQTCHIPEMAVDRPTKMTWDWSQSGRDDIPEDHLHYLKIKGSFTYEEDIDPEYAWYNGRSARYLAGDTFRVSDGPLALNPLCGTATDPDARIWPVKKHRANQPYDVDNHYLLIPKTVGEGGYWTDFDWNAAFELAQESTGLAYSGHYGFADTVMTWPLSHMTQESGDALQCMDCHRDGGRMDWQALGYDGDPARMGGRLQDGVVTNPERYRDALDGRPIRFSNYSNDVPLNPMCEEVTP